MRTDAPEHACSRNRAQSPIVNAHIIITLAELRISLDRVPCKFKNMSHNKAKKKRISSLFDFDNVKAEMEEQNKYFADFREHLEALRNTDIKRIMSDASLKEDEALQFLACKLSVESLNNLKVAIQHVPENIPRVVDGISLRLSYIYKIFSTFSSKHGGTQPTIEEVGLYVKFMETHCPCFLSKQDHLADFWTLTEKEHTPFNKFLTPPVRTCRRCQGLLTMRNYPAKVKLFTTDGPIPCSKITLECRGCSCVYGVCNFTDKLGTHFYPAETQIEMVEVSNVSYIELKLYKWFPSLR